MTINETKSAKNLLVNPEQISRSELQNRFGTRYETIPNLNPGKHLTILVVETDSIVSSDGYALLESTLKDNFGVRAMQTVFDASIPSDDLEEGQNYSLHINAHLRISVTG